MKTATVRDLRNRFADVAKWIEEGEEVSITRRGKAFATISPAKPAASAKVDWTQSNAFRFPVGKKLGRAETEAFYRDLKRDDF